MQDYRRLNVWLKAERLALDVVNALPQSSCRRVPGLRSQAIRAATAIPDLIAEGCGKHARIELARFCDMGLGSAAELRNHILRAMRSGIIPRDTGQKLDGMIDEVRRMLTGLSQAVRREVDRDLASANTTRQATPTRTNPDQPGPTRTTRTTRTNPNQPRTTQTNPEQPTLPPEHPTT